MGLVNWLIYKNYKFQYTDPESCLPASTGGQAGRQGACFAGWRIVIWGFFYICLIIRIRFS
jgi:hypothetical protein